MNRRSFISRFVGGIVAAVIAVRLKVPEILEEETLPVLNTEWYTVVNARRTFYSYPNSASPLVGLLSLLDSDTNPTLKWTDSLDQ